MVPRGRTGVCTRSPTLSLSLKASRGTLRRTCSSVSVTTPSRMVMTSTGGLLSQVVHEFEVVDLPQEFAAQGGIDLVDVAGLAAKNLPVHSFRTFGEDVLADVVQA